MIWAPISRAAIEGVAVALVAGGIFYAGYHVATLKADARAKAAAEAATERLIREVTAANNVAMDYEQAKAKREVITRTITVEVEREVEKPVYHECVLPDDGVRLINAARAEAADPGELDGTVFASPDAP